MASFAIKLGGHYIRYPDICRNYTFLKSDGVQGVIEYLMSSNLGGLTFPTHDKAFKHY
jgi:hypothetical protein